MDVVDEWDEMNETLGNDCDRRNCNRHVDVDPNAFQGQERRTFEQSLEVLSTGRRLREAFVRMQGGEDDRTPRKPFVTRSARTNSAGSSHMSKGA